MPYRIPAQIEFILGIITFASTTLVSDNDLIVVLVMKLVVGIVTYFTARILYRIFGDWIMNKIDRFKLKK